MNYVYDITINLKKHYLDFFEWNTNDKIINMHKLPIIKVSSKDLLNIISNSIEIEEDIINKIKVKNRYMSVFMSDDQALVVEFDKHGHSISKSSLMVDDELDIMENYYNLDTTKLSYNLLEKDTVSMLTRLEQEKRMFLNQEIKKLSLPKDSNKIKYLYYECYGMMEEDLNKALKMIEKCVAANYHINQLYHFFKLIEQK